MKFESDQAETEYFKNHGQVWDWRDGYDSGIQAEVFIDGIRVRFVRWCDIGSGLAEVYVCGDIDEPSRSHFLMRPGRQEPATAIVQGKIEVRPKPKSRITQQLCKADGFCDANGNFWKDISDAAKPGPIKVGLDIIADCPNPWPMLMQAYGERMLAELDKEIMEEPRKIT